MTREEAVEAGLKALDTNKCIIAELTTGFGKTKLALDMCNKLCEKLLKEENNTRILIIVAQIVHKQTWKDEIAKWGLLTTNVTFECYNSLHRHGGECYDIVILDEAQHLSPIRREWLKHIVITHKLICLSATLPREVREWLKFNYKTAIIKTSLQEAVDANVLPDPVIYTIPLYFDSFPTECIYKNTGKNLPVVECNWVQRWAYIRRKDVEVHIYCTKQQYLADLNSQIEWYKAKAMRNQVWAKTKWMRLCKDRLDWLAKCKNSVILEILSKLKNYRTLTFCASIEQTEILGKNCIHSKNKLSMKILEEFNAKKIKHITACNVLNEGVNLSECRFGIFANLNASEIMTVQRCGRLMRHKNPVLIMPYYKGTREEELVKKHLEGYNPNLIKKLNSVSELKV